ncbi:hypothetical protein [Maritimibacter sp. DP1N21-5]|uniref:hypothetical protein n=1 Tax=Maritimibacter sp. DP1N21-5 TaxID=2836867 RepID=UPI001C49110C|nr:hypothetical protein [Maritimibacter sp. DP1N21-5]MBV7410292.1 hypothetical protein [Maritimibacter sp. DP1N21-5]
MFHGHDFALKFISWPMEQTKRLKRFPWFRIKNPMGYWDFGRAALVAIALVTSSTTGAFALGSWQCVAMDGVKDTVSDAATQATLSKKFFVKSDGSLQVVDVLVEQPEAPRTTYEVIVDGLMDVLGIQAPRQFVDRVARADRKQGLPPEAIYWALSPTKPAGPNAWKPQC